MWELLKRFPTMPPFGEIWFAAFQEMDNPIAILRLEWIYLSLAEDRRIEHERRQDEIEYGGICAQPGALAAIKGWDKTGGRTTNDGFRIEVDTSAYDRRFDRATMGHADVKPRRTDVAETVRRKREEMMRTGIPIAVQRLVERRRRDADRYDALDEDDGLIIE
jgi:hypothetical protein